MNKVELVKQFNILSANELISKEIPEQKWIVKDLIPENSFIIWAGNKGCSKSLLNAYIGLCIATGNDVFGEFEVVKKGPVLYFDEENGVRRMKFRVTKIANGMDIRGDVPIEFYSVIKKGFKLDEEDGHKKFIGWISEIIKEYKPVYVVMDSLVRMMTGDENSSKDVRRLFDNLSPLMEKYNVTFSTIHHNNKSGGIRGSGDFGYMADKTFNVKRIGNSRTDFCLEQDKERDNDWIKNIEYRAKDSEDGSKILFDCLNVDRDDKQSMAEKLAAEIMKFMEVGKTYKKQEISEHLKRVDTDRSVQKALGLLKMNFKDGDTQGFYTRVR
jgi:RecA-family ATPase